MSKIDQIIAWGFVNIFFLLSFVKFNLKFEYIIGFGLFATTPHERSLNLESKGLMSWREFSPMLKIV